MTDILLRGEELLLQYALPLLLFLVGALYLFSLRGFPFLHPIRTLRHAVRGNARSALRALSVALGGTLGVGNITGVALAIAAGGAGALFWMWVSAAVAMFLKYAEIVLAMQTRRRANGEWEGGAMLYLREGPLGTLAPALFAILCLVCALTLGGPVQSNAAVEAAVAVWGVSPTLVGALLTGGVALAVVGGVKKIGAVTELVVPLFSGVYLCLSLFAVFSHTGELPAVFSRIWREAFTLPSGVAGVGGFLSAEAVRYGVGRGLFSHEAGAGTAPIAHAVAENTPTAQGVLGMVEVFVDTFVFCTATALPLLLAYPTALPDAGGFVLVREAFCALVGEGAVPLLGVSMLLFAYATLLAWCYYGRRALEHFTRREGIVRAYLCLFCLLSFVGGIGRESLVWRLADVSIALLTLMHSVLLLPFLPRVLAESRKSGLLGQGIRLVRQRERETCQRRAKIGGQRGEK